MPHDLPDLRAVWADMSVEERLHAFLEYHAATEPVPGSDSHPRRHGYEDAIEDVRAYVLEGMALPDPENEFPEVVR